MSNLEELYNKRTFLLEVVGVDLFDADVLAIEKEIDSLEDLPDFEEVIEMIATGRIRSIFA